MAHLRPDLLEKGTELILKGLGVSQRDPNYQDTPERYAKALLEMFEPTDTDWATFEEKYTDFILLKNHRLYSLCPHHLLPVKFFVSLAYIPNGHVLGLSKLARLLDECNDGPLLQERFTTKVIEKVGEICPGISGAACLIEGTHGCMEMRGVKSDAHFITYKLGGVFQENASLEDRFFRLATR